MGGFLQVAVDGEIDRVSGFSFALPKGGNDLPGWTDDAQNPTMFPGQVIFRPLLDTRLPDAFTAVVPFTTVFVILLRADGLGVAYSLWRKSALMIITRGIFTDHQSARANGEQTLRFFARAFTHRQIPTGSREVDLIFDVKRVDAAQAPQFRGQCAAQVRVDLACRNPECQGISLRHNRQTFAVVNIAACGNVIFHRQQIATCQLRQDEGIVPLHFPGILFVDEPYDDVALNVARQHSLVGDAVSHFRIVRADGRR